MDMAVSKVKRVRVDNADGAAAAHAAAVSPPPSVPSHITLRECDKPFWDAIVRARARDEWGRVELVLAAQLAWIQADIEAEKHLIAGGDRAKMDEAGYPSVKAVRMSTSSLLQQQVVLMRALRMIGTMVGDPEDEIPRRKAERDAERTIKRLREGEMEADSDGGEPPLLAV